MLKRNSALCALLALLFSGAMAQQKTNTLPYNEIYAYGMDTDVTPIFPLLEVEGLNAKDQKFKSDFEARFKGASDLGASSPESEMETLISHFKNYWRKSLLDTSGNFERELGGRVLPFLMKNYPPVRGKKVTRDSLGYFLRDYIRAKGLFTTDEVTYHGRLIDLVIWKKQTPKVYAVDLGKGEIQELTVYFLEDFATLGWMEYATLGAHHPGGWTEEEGIYCVKKAYDVNSENFKISYLTHEARHYADKKLWPDLKSADLEYRAKLTELNLAQDTLFELIAFFAKNANKESENGHQVANYCVIRDLSQKLFKSDFETSGKKWEKISTKKINKAAGRLLKKNTKELKSKGMRAQTAIKV
ncbi:hypothetical protein [Flagellimonas algicola]|uniref:Uncharacterized protein n=1 Tax=Flagellimonas algicola TaxID=2583815 RepID=A0ABY2WI60_9FLAO|nr:hypothetical protein [Allomuricauda algicola]TMU51006.1 hypothetical protein FGG15_17435 [Allomuricauda algicola]